MFLVPEGIERGGELTHLLCADCCQFRDGLPPSPACASIRADFIPSVKMNYLDDSCLVRILLRIASYRWEMTHLTVFRET